MAFLAVSEQLRTSGACPRKPAHRMETPFWIAEGDRKLLGSAHGPSAHRQESNPLFSPITYSVPRPPPPTPCPLLHILGWLYPCRFSLQKQRNYRSKLLCLGEAKGKQGVFPKTVGRGRKTALNYWAVSSREGLQRMWTPSPRTPLSFGNEPGWLGTIQEMFVF